MIRLRFEGEGAVVTLDQPHRANSLSEEMIDALSQSVDEARAGGARALLIEAAGRNFCAGGSLSQPLPDDAGAILEHHLNPLLLKLADLPIPIVSAVQGVAAGAGLSLALAADMVIAADGARFSTAFASVGLAADGGSTWLLPRLVGVARAMRLLLLAEPIDASVAEAWGLVGMVVPDADLARSASATLARLAAGPTLALGLIRRNVRDALAQPFAAALAAERKAQRQAGLTADFAEGAAAFRDRRTPVFTGCAT